MTDAQLFQFADRLLEGRVAPDEFRTLTVDDARRLSYFLRRRPSTRRTPCERPLGQGSPRSYSERELLSELGLE